jgi:putative phosphoesterase
VLIGIVSDIHCNSQALLRAIDFMGEVDELVCLGDSISEYRFSNEVVQVLRDRRFTAIQGNHEQMFFSPAGARARAAAWIDPELMSWLSLQPRERLLRRDGRQILLVHSTPWPPGGQYVCVNDRDFGRFAESGADVLLYGHTHQPVVQRVGDTLVINPGSTGEARPGDWELTMSCAVLDVTSLEARIIDFSPLQRDASS